jgi:DNA-binding transcriptional ArsR family regulator/YHS domain-containing protein
MYQQLFALHAEKLKAMSHPKRLEVIHLLRDKTLSVTEIQDMLDLPQANLSQHLQVLRDAHIVIATRKGKQMFYKLSDPKYMQSCDLIRSLLIEEHEGEALSDEFAKDMEEFLPIVTDPVCGMRLSPKTTGFATTFHGQTYYFCASGCLKKFNHRLERYGKA